MVRSKMIRTWGNAAASIVAMTALVIGAAGCGSADPTPPAPQLNAHCDQPGATDKLADGPTAYDGRTVYCTQVEGTDTHVWAYTRGPLQHDPNARGYTCDDKDCHFPDGGPVPGYQRCGILCGEPPTSGDVQSGFADCFNAGTPFEECERRSQDGH